MILNEPDSICQDLYHISQKFKNQFLIIKQHFKKMWQNSNLSPYSLKLSWQSMAEKGGAITLKHTPFIYFITSVVNQMHFKSLQI